MKRAGLRAAMLAALLLLGPAAAAADPEPEPPPASEDRPHMSADRFEQVAEGEIKMTGNVDLWYGDLRILADSIHYDDARRIARAEGNVVLMFGNSQISGDRLEANLDTKLATIWNAHGQMEPDVIFHAEMLERIAEDKIVITNGTVTTCTQPTPYWSFHVSKATLQKDHYAHMKHVAFRVSAVPVFYTPYLAWPLKEDRSSGLLLPNIGYSRRRGSFIGNALYLVMGRSQDMTLYFDLYGQSGTGYGFEYRFVPALHAQGALTGYYLDDTVDDPSTTDADESRARYRFNLRHAQRFDSGYRLIADLNAVSDLDYYLDFERDIRQTTSPTVYSRIDLTRNWRNYALNARLDRQEQFITTDEQITLQRIPELELRAHGLRIHGSPIYVSFVSSAGLYNKQQVKSDDPNIPFIDLESTYARYDLFPTIAASFSPTPWLDISPSVAARGTLYTRGLVDPNLPLQITDGEDIFRGFASFNLTVIGPRFFRLFGTEDGTSNRYKHTFEPGISYSYIPKVRGDDENIIRFDEVDTLAGDLHRMTYSLTSRLFAKRPPKMPDLGGPSSELPVPSDVTGPTQATAPLLDEKDLPEEVRRAIEDRNRAPGVGSVEIASFSISQIFSFDEDQPFMAIHVEPDGTAVPLDSPAGPIVANGRYNPHAAASLDATVRYEPFFDNIDTVSFSANLRSLKLGYLRMSYFLDRDLSGRFVNDDGISVPAGDPNGQLDFVDGSQIRLLGGTSFLRRKITLDLEGSYDIENGDLQDQRYRVGYNSQCCGILVEMARRDFDTIDEIEYRFTLNLRGVGTFLDLQGRP